MSHQPPHHSDSLDAPVSDDPPPAYTSIANDTSLQTGPAHPDFSGPPPMPDRLSQNITGVGMGYGRRHDSPGAMASQATGPGWGMSPQPTGAGWGGGGGGGYGENNTAYSPPASLPPPPQHPTKASSALPPPPPGRSGAGPSRPMPQNLSPTESPTPGRPLLHNGMILIYPKGQLCPRCGNTGYVANDPSNPCTADWRRYGKHYSSAVAHSYTIATGPASNPSTQEAGNFQRPLPDFASAGAASSSSGNPYSHLPPPPGKWSTFPGQSAPPRPPPPMQYQQQQPQSIFVQQTDGPVPPGALVVRPGDPRIGGRSCWRCGGSGRELGFFGFDDSRCGDCRGLGRLF